MTMNGVTSESVLKAEAKMRHRVRSVISVRHLESESCVASTLFKWLFSVWLTTLKEVPYSARLLPASICSTWLAAAQWEPFDVS